MMDCAPAIVAWEYYLLHNAKKVIYTQGSARMSDVHHPGGLPMYSDCSSKVECTFAWAGAPDPSRLNFAGGNTDSQVIHGVEVTADRAQPGNTLVFYYDGKGYAPANTVHVATVVKADPHDPLTISHGSDPISLVRVSRDGRPHKFFRFDTMGHVAHYPPSPQRFTAGMSWTPNAGKPGDWLVAAGRKAGFPSPDELHAAQAHSVPKIVQSAAALGGMKTVPWGTL